MHLPWMHLPWMHITFTNAQLLPLDIPQVRQQLRQEVPALAFFLEKLGVDAVACAVSWLNLFVCWSGCCQMLSVGPGMSEPGHVQWRGQGLCQKSGDETGPTLCLNLLTCLSSFFPNSKVQNFNVMFPNLRWTHCRQTTAWAECSFQSGDVPCQWEARLDPDRFLQLWLLQEFKKVPESRSELEFQCQVSCPSCPTFQDSKPEGDDRCQLSQMFAARWIFWLSNWIDCLRNKAVYNWSLQFVLQITDPLESPRKKSAAIQRVSFVKLVMIKQWPLGVFFDVFCHCPVASQAWTSLLRDRPGASLTCSVQSWLPLTGSASTGADDNELLWFCCCWQAWRTIVQAQLIANQLIRLCSDVQLISRVICNSFLLHCSCASWASSFKTNLAFAPPLPLAQWQGKRLSMLSSRTGCLKYSLR